MRNGFLFLFFVYLQLNTVIGGYSQPTFKTLVDGVSSRGTNIIQVDSGFLLGDFGDASILVRLDTNGIFQEKKVFYHSPFMLGSGDGSLSFVLRSNQDIVLPVLGINWNFVLGLGAFNYYSKSFSWFRGYNIVDTAFFDAVNFPITLHPSADNGFLISTRKRTDLLYLKKFPLVVYTDSIGQVRNSYRFNEHYGVAMFTHQFNDGSLISGINFTGDTTGASLVRYDTTGQVIWAKNYFGKKSIFYSSVNNHNGTLTILGCPDTTFSGSLIGGTLLSPWFLMKVDTSGSLLWCKLFGDNNRAFRNSFPGQVKATDDGGYVMTGFTCDTTVSWLNGSDLIIIKTDSNGDTLWTRAHGNAYTEDGGQDINQTTDGGYIVCGYSSSAQFWGGGYLVIKTDSLGMTDTHCQEFNVPIAVSSVVPPDSAITLTITTGLISSVPSSVYDTTYTIQQKNGCWLSAVGIEEAPSLPANPYTAIPNPSRGVFTLMANGEFSGLKTFIGMDILGHELFKSQSESQDPSFDLSSYPSGIYFIKIIGGGRVDVAKVVVER